MASIPVATDPPAMSITLMKNTLIIGRTLTPGIRVMRITKLAPSGRRGIGLLARAALAFANAAAAFPR